jgi:hypothetical protein
VEVSIKAGQLIALNVPNGGHMGDNYGAGEAAFFQPTLATGSTGTSAEYAGELGYDAQVQASPSESQNHPVSASTAGGIPVTILGSGFENVISVCFGATPATGFTVNSEDALTAIAPPSAAGVVSVFVTTKGGTTASAQAFTFQAPAGAGPSSGSGNGKKTTAPASTFKCKKGTRRKVVKGKARCVKAKKHKHHRHHGH